MAQSLIIQLTNISSWTYHNVPLVTSHVGTTIMAGIAFFVTILNPDHFTFPATWKTFAMAQTRILDVFKCTIIESAGRTARATSVVVSIRK